MTKLLLSRKEIAVKERSDKAKALWDKLRKEYPEAKKDRIADTIAEEMHLTKMGVYQILKRAGVPEFK